MVYLPFEDIRAIVHLLDGFKSYQFHVYSSSPCSRKPEHIHIRPLSRLGFQDDFRDCSGVICNAGFELASEALQMGKKLLVKPLRAQMEQLSNALALEQIQLGAVMPDLDEASVAYWLKNGSAHRVIYPNVAEAVVDWMLAGDPRIGPTCEWDTAAAHCIVKEAGGRVTDLKGRELRYNARESFLNPYFLAFGDKNADWSRYAEGIEG